MAAAARAGSATSRAYLADAVRSAAGGADGVRDRLKGMIMGMYIGDALAVPSHW